MPPNKILELRGGFANSVPMPPTPPPLPRTPAGFGFRFAAHLIDSALWSLLMSCIIVGLFWEEIVKFLNETMSKAASGRVLAPSEYTLPLPMWFSVIFQYIIPAAVLVAMWKWKSDTPGKILLGLKVVDADTRGPLTIGQCLIRMAGYLPPMIPLIFLSFASLSAKPWLMFGAAVLTSPLLWGFLRIIRDPLKQGWHDKMARTLVVIAR